MLKKPNRPATGAGKLSKRMIALCMSLIACTSIAEKTRAQDMETEYEFHIEAKSLGDALDDFVEQTGLMVLFPRELADVEGMNPVIGSFSASDALDQLFSGTSFSGGLTKSGAIFIAQNKTSREEEMASGNLKKGLLASVAAFVFGGAQAQDVETVDDNAQSDEAQAEDVIVVTGTNIRGVENLATPSFNLDRDELESAGYSSLEEAFESLPQNLSEISFVGAVSSGVSEVASLNTQRASGISLRGLGPQSTLVLLNGKRRPGAVQGRVFDVSAIPLSAVERVEVVTGGRSAIYGSDAVAGVVNLDLRRDFEGAESQLFFSSARNGGERINASQILGHSFERGNVMLAYDFARDRDLDVTEAGRVSENPTGAITPVPGQYDLVPDNWRQSVLASGKYELTDKVSIYADGFYSFDKNKLDNDISFSGFELGLQQSNSSEQYSIAGGIEVNLLSDWVLDVSGVFGVSENRAVSFSSNPFSGTTRIPVDDRADLWSISAIADGPVGRLFNNEIRAAIGVETRTEEFERNVFVSASPISNIDRDVQSLFGEVNIPLVQNGSMTGLRTLEVTAAIRYDDYSDFGDTTNPQFGIIWSPIQGLNLRGAYSTAFRAPDLFVSTINPNIQLRTLTDPMATGGVSQTLVREGTNSELFPEDATTWSAGFDYAPEFADWMDLSITYYNINYEDRIDRPAVGSDIFTVLVNEGNFGALVERNPSASDIAGIVDNASSTDNFSGIPFDFATQNLLDVFPDLILFDNRRSNIGSDKVSGIDIQLNASFSTGIGDVSADLNANYIIDFDRRVTSASPEFSQLNEPGKPVDTRIRGHLGWSAGAASANLFVNYADGYENTLVTPSVRLGSFTTVDLSVSIDGAELAKNGVINGTRLTFGVNNLFDEQPPELVGNTFNLNFDGVNANPRGRVLSARIIKRW